MRELGKRGKLGRQFVGAGLTDNVTQQTNNLTKPALVGEQEEMRKNFSYSPITYHQSPILAIAKWQQGMILNPG